MSDGLPRIKTPPAPPTAAQANIAAIVQMEEADEQRLSHTDRLSERIGAFAGTVLFILLQLALVALWIAVNTGSIPAVPVFDPYPFSLMSAVLSLEGVLLTAFVLIRQNRMSLKADRRSHLDLQVNLLAEKEVTKIMQVLQVVTRHLGIEAQATDRDVEELSQETAVDTLAERLHATLDTDAPREPDAVASPEKALA